ncbi:MAG: hypothetical protein R3C62_20575 [Chloroflexota bacterium]
MLKVPAYEYFPEFGVTAYQDDSMFWKFYLIPDVPSVRKDVNGNPVFLLIKYAFGDQDREENPDLPRGGGYLAFDVALSIPDGNVVQIKQRLQQRVDQDWNMLKSIAENAGKDVRGYRVWSHHPGKHENALSVDDVRLGLPIDVPEAPPGDQPPKVIIDYPTWTDGKFSVSAPQSEALVSHRVTDGPLSLVGNNTAAVNMDLTEAGATFMERTLVNPDGSGATDLTPIQVVYELKFWARIPPVRLMIEADSRSLHAALKEVDHDYDGHDCSEDDMSHYETQLGMAIDAGLIKVRFDTGTLSLDDDFVQQIRATAMKLVQDMIKDSFFQKKEAPPADTDDPTADFVNSEKDIYYIKTEVDYSQVSINYDEEMTSIVEWKVNPQGTMQAFFSDLSAAEMKKYVRVVDLDDDFFKTLGLSVTAFADWDNEPIAFIECQINYSGRDENNQLVEKVETFTFTKDNHTGSWDPSLIGSKREYQYRWRVAFHGREPDRFSRWFRETSPHLNLTVADPGKIAINLLAGNIDFAHTVEQVQVEISYRDPGSGVDEEATTFILADGQKQQNYSRYIYTDWDRPVQYRTRFFLKDGQMIEGEWQETLNRQLLINAPLYDKLDVRLVPAGSWDNVVQSVISLRYQDPTTGYNADEALLLKAANEFRAWAVVLQDTSFRHFQYRVLTTFKNGTFTQSAWIDADGDQAIPIIVEEVPHLRVNLLPNLLDFATTPVVECTLRYHDAVGNIHKVETFTFTSGQQASWSFPLAAATRNEYSYEITYHTVDGRSITLPQQTSDETALIIPRLLVPEINCTFIPKLLDFAATPVVEVAFDYEDPAHGLDFADTLIFTSPTDQQIQFPIFADSPDQYTLTVGYYLPDGTVINREPVTLDKKRVIIPRYVNGA